MILTHFLVIAASPALPVGAAASVLPLASTQPLITSGLLELALVPALPVRAAQPTLSIRER